MSGGCSRPIAASLILVLAVSLLAAAGARAAPLPSPVPLATAHAPIRIQSNADFTAANGVVSGSGTSTKPYLIQGWSIDATAANGIDIRNTTAYFVVDQVTVCCGGANYLGIVFENLSHGSVRDSDVASSLVGFRAGDSSYVSVLNGNFSGGQDGMDLWYTNYANVTGANLTGNTGYGLWVNVGYSVDLWSDTVTSSQGVGFELAASSYVRVGQGHFMGYSDAIHNPDLVMSSLFAGNYIQSYWASALYLDSGSYLTIRDNVLGAGYGYAFYLGNGHDDVLAGNTIYGGPKDCLYLSLVQNLSVANNKGGGCTGYVLHLASTGSNVTVQGNDFYGAMNGILLEDAAGTTVSGNTLAGIGIRLAGTGPDAYRGLTITSDNLLSGLPILYSKDCGSVAYTSKSKPMGEILAANCTSLSVSNLTFTTGSVAIQAAYVGSVSLYGVTISNQNDSGFLFQNVGQATVAASSFGWDWFGENATGSGTLSVVNTTFQFPGDGLAVNGGTIHMDNATFSGLPYGANLNGVTGGTIKDSRFGGSAVATPLPGWGGALNAVSSRDVTVLNSSFVGNVGGITLSGTTGFRIFHNTFDSNGRDAWDGNPGANFWNASYPTGGNNWTVYHGWDDCHGPLQDNCTAGDGIGDVPYDQSLYGYVDHYPLLAVNPPKVWPVAALSVDAANVTTGSTVTFTSTSYDPTGWPLLRETLDFGDGTNYTGDFATMPHTYTAPGNYTVTLTVESMRHLTNTTSLTVAVITPPPPQPLALVDYVSWRGYVCPVPATWSRTYNWTSGGSTFELFLQGSLGGYSANLIVDSEAASGVQQTADYLNASVDATLSSVQQKLPDAYLSGPIQIVSVPGGLGATFTIAYGSHAVLQDGLLVVNQTDARVWTVILSWPSAVPDQLAPTFDAIVSGFRITSAPPASNTNPPANTTGPPPGIFAFAQWLGPVLLILIVVIAVVAYLYRRRNSKPAPPLYGSCLTCGAPLQPGAQFCVNCGSRLGGGPPPGPGT